MKIEVWSDFTCPHCFLGKKRFDLALEQFGNHEAIELEFKSFELAPDARENESVEKAELLIDKYGMTREEILYMNEDITRQGRELGLELTIDNVVHTNTFQAHRLVKYSNDNNKAQLLMDLLFNSYFVHKENIGNRHVLQRLAVEAGLDSAEVDALLCLNKYSRAVRHDEELAEELGISAVPFFIFNEELALSGAQSTEVFIRVLNELWEEEAMLTDKKKQQGKSYCAGNECNLD